MGTVGSPMSSKTPRFAVNPNSTSHQPKFQKNELDRQNPKHINAASHLPSRQPLIQLKKRASSSSNLNAYASQRNFYKRNLNRYSREHWPFQPCLIGRP
uniref:testis-expressed protein 48 isoform X4 n=1 Tax=Callithrix jacchus TaxID=9483 RepID=UPI0004F0714B|nr:testis-expressed protein 48 isoform X4 [Callithrix jacchus]